MFFGCLTEFFATLTWGIDVAFSLGCISTFPQTVDYRESGSCLLNYITELDLHPGDPKVTVFPSQFLTA